MHNEKIEQGDLITLSDGVEYLVFAVAPNPRGNFYIYLSTQSQTPSIRFLEQVAKDGHSTMQELSGQAEKLEALKILQSML